MTQPPRSRDDQAELVTFQQTGLTKGQAEELLDWLENNGYSLREMEYQEGQGFLVRWQGRPAPAAAMTESRSLPRAIRHVLTRIFGLQSPPGHASGSG